MSNMEKKLVSKIIFFVTIILNGFCLIKCAPLAPALYVFGDSLYDCGNNNNLPTMAKVNYPPYGMNYDKGPTGRFTNGKIIPDYIAEYLGLPSPPPGSGERPPGTLTGFNYASGSCGILPESGSALGKCWNFDEQLNLFESTVKSLPMKTPDELNKYLSKSIFIITIGSNDYLNNYFEPTHYNTSKQYDPKAYSKFLIDQFSSKLQRLYNLGARKIVIYEIGPMGCIPSYTRSRPHKGPCVDDMNDAVDLFNKELPGMQKKLTSTLKGSSFVLGLSYTSSYDLMINPSKYGLKESTKGCCESFANGTTTCIPNLPGCANPQDYVFFDAYHLTQAAYSIVAKNCISGSTSDSTPVNIKQLVEL